MLKIKQFSPVALTSVLLGIFLLPLATVANPEEPTPWALRDHYTFKGEHATFNFDVKTAEWMVEVQGRGVVVEDVQCEIEFANGEILRLSSLSSIKDGREKFTGPIGEGTYFRSTFRTSQSLQIDYSVARFKSRPFLLLYVSMHNRSAQPIEIAAVRPVMLEAGSVSNLGADTKITRLGTGRRGIFPVVYDNGDASLVRFEFTKPNVTLGIGLLQTGLMDSSIQVQSSGASWQGTVECVYDPPLRIEPGAKVGSDPVWLSFSLDSPSRVHEFHAWAESVGTPTLNIQAVPSAWITVDSNLPVTALYDAARKWVQADLEYVLVPSGWEDKPGSLRGSKPNYPRDMSKVAGEIVAIGMHPGITVDPLAVTGGDQGWSVHGQDGGTWLDVTNSRAYEYGTEQMQSVVDWGFQFLVVEPSKIPDDVLHALNLTRAKADSLALEIAARASQGRPVFPSAALTLGVDLAKWQDAAAATAFYRSYGMVAGPVQLRVNDLADLSRALGKAIAQYAGPVEYVGYPKRKVRRNLVSLRGASYASYAQMSR